MNASAGWPTLAARLVLRALVNPRLALDLVRLTWSFRARDWYRRAPFLPLPPREYLRWRMFTAYGDEDRSVSMPLESRASRRMPTPASSTPGSGPDTRAR